MKRILAVAAMLAVISAKANSELKFGDLNYFFKQGQFNLSADFNSDREQVGPTSSKTVVTGQYIDSKLSYGILDNLNAYVAMTYNFDVEVDPAGPGGRNKADGPQNPYFGVDYRLMDQKSSGFNLDLGAVVKYNIMDLEVGDANDEGDTVDPILSDRSGVRDSVELNIRLGNKWNEANEFYLLAGVVQNFKSKYDDLTEGSKDKITIDNSTDFKLGAFYQYRPVNEFMMKVGVIGTRVDDTKAKFPDNTKLKLDSHTDYDFIFQAKYLVLENLIVKFNFEQGRNSDYDYGPIKIEKRREHMWGLGVDWIF